MILCDVNVLIYAFREDMEHHDAAHRWLLDRLAGFQPVALASVVASGFVRIVTNRRVFGRPSTTAAAFGFLGALWNAPNVVRVSDGPRHAEIFEHLCTTTRATGPQVPDAYLAALAIESGSELASTDRGFARFPGLRWSHPLDKG